MKVISKIFKGIEYIQLNQLPAEQRDSLLKTINQKVLIKILIDGKIVSDCIQYRDYEIWFDNIYSPKGTPSATFANTIKTVPANITAKVD